MAAAPHDPDTRRKVPNWARVVIGFALVPVIVLGPFVVLALWPGLEFRWTAVAPNGKTRGLSVWRSSPPRLTEAGVAAHFGFVQWNRSPAHGGCRSGWYKGDFGSTPCNMYFSYNPRWRFVIGVQN